MSLKSTASVNNNQLDENKGAISLPTHSNIGEGSVLNLGNLNNKIVKSIPVENSPLNVPDIVIPIAGGVSTVNYEGNTLTPQP